MIRKVKAIVKDRILTSLGVIITLAGLYMLIFKDISDVKLIILFSVGGGFILAPEKIIDKIKDKI